LSLPTLLNRLRRLAAQAVLPFEGGTPNPDPGTLNAEPIFVRHPRARRYIVRVADDGTVRVTVPRWGSKREARAFAEQQRAWIEKQQQRAEQDRLRPRSAALAPDVEREFRVRASRELPVRLLELAAQHGLTVSRVSVRNQRWRWGSCSPKGHICLNWRLVTMPEWVRDYVLIHELMHLKRLDHSPKFWTLVAQACPEYQDARRYLRSHGSNTLVVS
jgi:predicted metal-dependent hydrolase